MITPLGGSGILHINVTLVLVISIDLKLWGIVGTAILNTHS